MPLAPNMLLKSALHVANVNNLVHTSLHRLLVLRRTVQHGQMLCKVRHITCCLMLSFTCSDVKPRVKFIPGLFLQTEKELQNGGEIKELADVADKLSKRLVKDTTAWTNKKESLAADAAACQQASCFHGPTARHQNAMP